MKSFGTIITIGVSIAGCILTVNELRQNKVLNTLNAPFLSTIEMQYYDPTKYEEFDILNYKVPISKTKVRLDSLNHRTLSLVLSTIEMQYYDSIKKIRIQCDPTEYQEIDISNYKVPILKVRSGRIKNVRYWLPLNDGTLSQTLYLDKIENNIDKKFEDDAGKTLEKQKGLVLPPFNVPYPCLNIQYADNSPIWYAFYSVDGSDGNSDVYALLYTFDFDNNKFKKTSSVEIMPIESFMNKKNHLQTNTPKENKQYEYMYSRFEKNQDEILKEDKN